MRYLGEFDTSEAATRKWVAKLAAKYDQLTFCYEAGPTGYGLYRLLRGLDHASSVAAPSLIPKKPGDRIKTTRVRHVLIEAGWSYRHPPRISRGMQARVAAAPRTYDSPARSHANPTKPGPGRAERHVHHPSRARLQAARNWRSIAS